MAADDIMTPGPRPIAELSTFCRPERLLQKAVYLAIRYMVTVQRPGPLSWISDTPAQGVSRYGPAEMILGLCGLDVEPVRSRIAQQSFPPHTRDAAQRSSCHRPLVPVSPSEAIDLPRTVTRSPGIADARDYLDFHLDCFVSSD